jgi:ankyrin repeat protein
MKKLIIILLITTLNPIFGQEKDEQLFNASLKNDTELFKKILNEGANVNYIKSVGPWMKVNSLIYSVRNKNIEITKLLLENGIDVNWKDGFNSSAIMYAAYTGKIELVELLLKYGGNINDNDGKDSSVLTAAKESKNRKMIKFVKMKIKEKK